MLCYRASDAMPPRIGMIPISIIQEPFRIARIYLPKVFNSLT
jgi:hypothetical protein